MADGKRYCIPEEDWEPGGRPCSCGCGALFRRYSGPDGRPAPAAVLVLPNGGTVVLDEQDLEA